MNECNQPLFVNPQWNASGQNQSAAICGRALAAAYDALKAVSRVELRLGRRPLAARQRHAERAPATPRPRRSSSSATLGAWFRAFAQKTHRTAPLMDGLDFHPYPVPQSLPFATGYARPARRERLEPAADLPGVLRRRSTARRSGRSASSRAAACRVSLNEMGIQTDATGQPGYSGHRGRARTPPAAWSASSRPRPTRRPSTSRCSQLLACDPNVRVRQHLPPRRRAEPRRLAERALLGRRPDAGREAVGDGGRDWIDADRRALPGEAGRRGRRRRAPLPMRAEAGKPRSSS